MATKPFHSTKGHTKEYTNGDAKRVLKSPTTLPNLNKSTRKKK